MDDQARAIGWRVRYWRKRRNLDRQRFADHVAAEEVRCRPLAHGVVRSLLDATSGESGRLVRQMAIRAGLTA